MKYHQLISFLLDQPFNRSLGDDPVLTIVRDSQRKTSFEEFTDGEEFNRCGLMLTMIDEEKPKNYGDVAKIIEEWAEIIKNAHIAK
jgi:hypothetical protein